MRVCSHQKGQSLIEIVFAIALFTVGVVTIGYLIIDASASVRYGIEQSQARLFVSEGLEAVRSMRDEDFDGISPGVYGLILQGGVWAFTEESDSQGKFTRTITISEIDSEVRLVSAVVAWEDSGGRDKNITMRTYFSNWAQTDGDAGRLWLDTDDAQIIASSTTITGIMIENIGMDTIVIDGLLFDTDANVNLEYVSIGGVEVFNASTSASASPQTFVDIDDYSLLGYSGLMIIDSIQFDGSIEGSDFIITFVASDSSKRHVHIIN